MMPYRLSSQSQIFFALIISLLVAWSLYFILGENSGNILLPFINNSRPGNNHPLTEPTVTMTPSYRYENSQGVLYVSVRLYVNAQPEVVNAAYLSEGRVTASVTGNSYIRLRSSDMTVLYEVPFLTDFRQGEPPVMKDSIRMSFVLPGISLASHLEIDTPQGITLYELPPR